MKKTMIALLALSSIAMAENALDTTPVLTLTDCFQSSTASGTVSDGLSGADGFTAVITLNVNAVRAIAEKGSSSTVKSPMLLSASGYKDTNPNYVLGFGAAHTNADNAIATSGIYMNFSSAGNGVANNTNSAPVQNNTQTGLAAALSDLDWDTVQHLAVTWTYSESGTPNALYVRAVTLNSDGQTTVTQWAGSNGTGKYTGVTWTGFNIATDYVESLTVYSGRATAEQAFLIAPEPATATLSLLALAGLAARRRRH